MANASNPVKIVSGQMERVVNPLGGRGVPRCLSCPNAGSTILGAPKNPPDTKRAFIMGFLKTSFLGKALLGGISGAELCNCPKVIALYNAENVCPIWNGPKMERIAAKNGMNGPPYWGNAKGRKAPK